jgi:hypothetical protein
MPTLRRRPALPVPPVSSPPVVKGRDRTAVYSALPPAPPATPPPPETSVPPPFVGDLVWHDHDGRRWDVPAPELLGQYAFDPADLAPPPDHEPIPPPPVRVPSTPPARPQQPQTSNLKPHPSARRLPARPTVVWSGGGPGGGGGGGGGGAGAFGGSPTERGGVPGRRAPSPTWPPSNVLLDAAAATAVPPTTLPWSGPANPLPPGGGSSGGF